MRTIQAMVNSPKHNFHPFSPLIHLHKQNKKRPCPPVLLKQLQDTKIQVPVLRCSPFNSNKNKLTIESCPAIIPSFILSCRNVPPPPLALLFSVRKGHHHFHVVVGKESRHATKGSLKPVFIDLTDQGDDVTLLEAQLSVILWLKVKQGFTAWLGQRKIHRSRGSKGWGTEQYGHFVKD